MRDCSIRAKDNVLSFALYLTDLSGADYELYTFFWTRLLRLGDARDCQSSATSFQLHWAIGNASFMHWHVTHTPLRPNAYPGNPLFVSGSTHAHISQLYQAAFR